MRFRTGAGLASQFRRGCQRVFIVLTALFACSAAAGSAGAASPPTADGLPGWYSIIWNTGQVITGPYADPWRACQALGGPGRIRHLALNFPEATCTDGDAIAVGTFTFVCASGYIPTVPGTCLRP